MNPRLATGVGIVAIASIVASIVWLTREVTVEREPKVKATFVVICEECLEIREATVTAHDFGAAFPLVCQRCGAHQAYPAYVCDDCGCVFGFHPRAVDDPRPPELSTCPDCGSFNVRPFILGEDFPPEPPEEH